MTRDNEPTSPSDAPVARGSGGGASAATRRDTRGHDPSVTARHDSEISDTNVNDPDLEGRRGAREEGRPVRITVNRTFAEEVGPEGVRSYVDVLARVGEASQGVPASEVTEQLLDAWSAAGVHVEPIEAGKIAEKVADPTRGDIIIVDSADNELYGRDIPEGMRSARQDEPDDPDRPVWA